MKGFKDFILRGNVIDLAVAVVIGAAFGAIVTAFTGSIIKPLIAAIGGAESPGLGVTLRDRHPAHRDLKIVGADGISRTIEVTAIPLFAHADEFVGAIAVFWERAEA